VEGFELFAPPAAFDRLWARAVAAGAVPLGLAAWEVARVEAGRPEWGLDMDDATLPQEANLDELHAISYTKGCYTGQEVVARIHFRGHVNRVLRTLHFDHALPDAGAKLLWDGRPVGSVTSAVNSPGRGAIGLGIVRVEAPDGARLEVEGGAAAVVGPIPEGTKVKVGDA
jgi:folate-binding protein YgfZ